MTSLRQRWAYEIPEACEKTLIPQLLRLIDPLKASGFAPLITLAKTLANCNEVIVCMWRFSKSNGITEGFHRKM